MNAYLKLFVDSLEKYQKLNDAEFGRLIRAALAYKASGEEVKLNGREELLWDGMKLEIDRDNNSYAETCEARSAAGKKGAEARWQKNGKNGNCHFANGKEWQKCQDKDKEKEKEKDEDKDKDNTPHKPPKGGFDAFVKKAFEEFAGDDADLLNALHEFAAMRKRIKSPIATEQTVTRLLNKLQTDFQRYEWVDVLNQSTDNNWKGIFPLKNEQRQQRRQTSNPFAEMLREEQLEQF